MKVNYGKKEKKEENRKERYETGEETPETMTGTIRVRHGMLTPPLARCTHAKTTNNTNCNTQERVLSLATNDTLNQHKGQKRCHLGKRLQRESHI